MKALVKLTGIVVFVFLSVSVKAQSLRIVYDFLQDEIHYYKTTPNDKKGKPNSTPVVGRNQIITVEVVNFNKFVFAADATYTSKVVEKQSEMGFLDLMGTMVNPMSATGFFTALGGTLPDEVGRGGVLSTRGASSAYDDIRDAYNKLTGIEATMRSADYAITKLNKLKYNPYLPTDTIVNLSNHLIQNIFHKPVMNPSDFASVIVKINEDYHESMATLSSSSAAFLKEYQSYAARNSGGFEG